MRNKIYGGRMNVYYQGAHILDRFSREDALRLDGKKCLIVPETHDLYSFLIDYVERREWFEKEFGGGNDKET